MKKKALFSGGMQTFLPPAYRSERRLCFHRHLSAQLREGGGWATRSQHLPPQDQDTTPSPWDQDTTHPPPPGPGHNTSLLPPDQVTTPPSPHQTRTQHPPPPGTRSQHLSPPPPGPGHNTYPPGTICRWAVRILLECILVFLHGYRVAVRTCNGSHTLHRTEIRTRIGNGKMGIEPNSP